MQKFLLRISIFLTLCFLVVVSGYNNLISKSIIEVDNLNKTKDSMAYTKVLEYDTIKTYNSNLPQGQTITKEEGHKGLAYVDETGEVVEIIENPINAKIEIGTGKKADYVGKMTGYGADCVGCSGLGTLSCKTKNGLTYSLVTNGYTYHDDEYGDVRIIAAALDEFPCGTIIEVNNPNLGTFNAIVLDTGGAMQKAWQNGIVHMDLAYVTEKDPSIHLTTSNNVKYSVKRWGY